jgi:hypothetical protein
MDDNNDKPDSADDKRRVMTPPDAWSQGLRKQSISGQPGTPPEGTDDAHDDAGAESDDAISQSSIDDNWLDSPDLTLAAITGEDDATGTGAPPSTDLGDVANTNLWADNQEQSDAAPPTPEDQGWLEPIDAPDMQGNGAKTAAPLNEDNPDDWLAGATPTQPEEPKGSDLDDDWLDLTIDQDNVASSVGQTAEENEPKPVWSEQDDAWLAALDSQVAAAEASRETTDPESEAATPPGDATPAADGSQNLDPGALLTDHQQVATPTKQPIWPLAVTSTALLLMVMGGVGAYLERSALQEQIVQLQQQRGTAGNLSIKEEKALIQENTALQQELSVLRNDYLALSDQLNALQMNLDPDLQGANNADDSAEIATTGDNARAEADAGQTELAVESAPEPLPTADSDPDNGKEKAEPSQTIGTQDLLTTENTETNTTTPGNADTTIAVTAGQWFVNVASYGRLQQAQDLIKQLREIADIVLLQAIERNGRTLHRVRTAGYANAAEAKADAQRLQTLFNTGPLWVDQLSQDDIDASTVVGGTAYSKKSTRAAVPAVEPVPADELGNTAAPQEATSETATEDTQSDTSAPPETGARWMVVVAQFASGVDADRLARDLQEQQYDAKVAVEMRNGTLLYTVQIMGLTAQQEAQNLSGRLSEQGDYPKLEVKPY